MKLCELLDSSVDFAVVRDRPADFIVIAKIGERGVKFHAFERYEDGQWFVNVIEKRGGRDYIHRNEHGIDPNQLTGSGNEFKVFSFFKRAMTELIKKKNPKRIIFHGAKGTRASIYKKLLKQAEGKYDVKMGEMGPMATFELVRK